jgi:hypothetical protein
MANEQNLKPCEYKLSREEAKKGGLASAESRKKRKAIKEQMELLLSLPLKNEKAKKQLSELGIEESEMTNQMAMIIKMYQTALSGGKSSVSAFNSIRDTIGEGITQQVQVTQVPKINDDVPKE